MSAFPGHLRGVAAGTLDTSTPHLCAYGRHWSVLTGSEWGHQDLGATLDVLLKPEPLSDEDYVCPFPSFLLFMCFYFPH